MNKEIIKFSNPNSGAEGYPISLAQYILYGEDGKTVADVLSQFDGEMTYAEYISRLTLAEDTIKNLSTINGQRLTIPGNIEMPTKGEIASLAYDVSSARGKAEDALSVAIKANDRAELSHSLYTYLEKKVERIEQMGDMVASAERSAERSEDAAKASKERSEEAAKSALDVAGVLAAVESCLERIAGSDDLPSAVSAEVAKNREMITSNKSATLDVEARNSALEAAVDKKVNLTTEQGKNLFDKDYTNPSVVRPDEEGGTGYTITLADGSTVPFSSATPAETHKKDDMPDGVIEGATYNPTFGWMASENGIWRAVTKRYPINGEDYAITMFDGGTQKYANVFDADGNYLGSFSTKSSDWNHMVVSASKYENAAYFRLNIGDADVKVTQIEKGAEHTPYEAYYHFEGVSKKNLPQDIIYKPELNRAMPNTGTIPMTLGGRTRTQDAHYDDNGLPAAGGNLHISPLVEIVGGLIYEFAYVFDARFYDADKNLLTASVVKPSRCYLAPANARYMCVQHPGNTNVSFAGILQSEYVDGEETDNVNNARKDFGPVAIGYHRHRATYIIGDSEAARFGSTTYGVTEIVRGTIFSSFGGHRTDVIATNVGVGTSGIGSVGSLRGCNAIIVAGTNDMHAEDDARLIAYHREMLHRLREMGVVEVFAVAPFWGTEQRVAEMRESHFLASLRRLYGGHFIDVMGHIDDCGLYFNPYHPSEFVQPAVGGSVDIHFKDVGALTECRMAVVGQHIFVSYYDGKTDKYKVNSINTDNNSINCTLVENGSGRRDGDAAGQYTETVSNAVWTGTKRTLGWVYCQNDINNVNAGRIPPSVYADNSVHFGKILSRIIADMAGMYYDVVG